MAVPRVIETSAFQVALRRIALIAASAVFFVTVQAQAQQAHTAPEGQVIVTGEEIASAPAIVVTPSTRRAEPPPEHGRH